MRYCVYFISNITYLKEYLISLFIFYFTSVADSVNCGLNILLH